MRILIIEDDELLRPLLVRALRDAGHDVDEAPDGRVGIRNFSACRADLVITDLVMPDQEGIATIRQIKRESPGTPVIAISGGSQNRNLYLELARRLGADATLAKPFSPEELEVAVNSLIGRRRGQ